jgi:ABC-2 type transport system permease protein
MRNALHAEWTKLRTLAGTGWLLLGTVVLTIGMSAAVCAAVDYSGANSQQDPVKISLAGIGIGQAIIAVLAVLAITGEYSTGMIRTTLAATPKRHTVLAAKAILLSAMTLVSGSIATLGCVAAGRLILPGQGFTDANGHSLLSLADGATVRAAAGSVLYLVLIGVLGLGIATTVRDSAVAIATVLGLVYLFPIIASLVTDPDWQRHFQQIGPMTAGLAIQNTINLDDLPIGPWAGVGVLTAWAAAALLAGGVVLRARDA